MNQFARESGYTGDSPAMLRAFEAIRRAGIEEARAAHFKRKAAVDEMKDYPRMFFAAIHPALSTQEAIEDASRFIATFRNLETWRQHYRADQLAKAKMTRVYARYFRRFGKRLWIERKAA